MLKTRSLFPHFGKFDLLGWKYGVNMQRLMVVGQSNETMLRNDHIYGLSMASSKVSITNYVMGEEKLTSTDYYYQENHCDHYKMVRVNYPVTYGYKTSSTRKSTWPFVRIVPSVWTYPSVASVKAMHDERLSKVDDQLRSEAYWDMRPKFEGEVSMLNFIYELKDFRSIAKLLSRSNRSNPLWALSQEVGTTRAWNDTKSVISAPFKSPTKTLAEAHLVNAFAIQPLISDLTAIVKQLHQMVDDAQSQFAASGAGNTRHWSKQLDPVASLTKVGTTSDPVSTWNGSSLQCKYSVTGTQTYVYTPRSRFNATLQYWGLVPSLEATWNALPFSFLVDYFISIGKSLKRMRVDQNVNAYRLSTLTESVKTKYSIGRFLSTYPNAANLGLYGDDKYYSSVSSLNPFLVDGYECTFYKRVPNVKPYYGPALPRIKVPSSNQLLNMAALARCFF